MLGAMAAPPQNLSFEERGGARGHAAAWVLVEQPAAREQGGFAELTATPPADPQAAGWTTAGASSSVGTAPPYDPAGATYPDPTRVTDDASAGLHGVESPDTYDLAEDETWTFGAYLRSADPLYVGVLVVVAPDGAVAAVLDAQTRELTFVGGVGVSPPVPTLVEVATAEVVLLDGGWARLSVSLRLAAAVANARPSLLSFADADGGLGYADGPRGSFDVWGFFAHPGALAPAEGFEGGWGANEGYLFQLAVPASAEFAVFPSADPGGAPWEGFDRWAVPYLFELGGAAASVAWQGPDPSEERFEGGWGNDAWADALVAPVGVVWGAGVTDDAEEVFDAFGWGEPAYQTTLGASAGATWAGDLADAVETFERVVDDVEYAAEPGTDKLLATGHPLVLDVRVSPLNVGGVPGDDFPDPLKKQLFYYVVSPTANDFKLSLAPGGAAENITTEGTGQQLVRADGRRYWNGPDINPTL